MNTGLEEIAFSEYESEITSLRKRVWNYSEKYVAERYFKNKFSDAFDKNSYHWIIKADGVVVASCRLSVHQKVEDLPDVEYMEKEPLVKLLTPIGSLNRLVIDPGWQGQGFGKLLDKVRFEKCQALHCRTIVGITHGKRCQQFVDYGFIRLFPIREFSNMPVSEDGVPSLFYKLL